MDNDAPCSLQVELDALNTPMAIRIAYSQRHMHLHSMQGLQHLPNRVVLRGGSVPKAETLSRFWLPHVCT